RPFKKRRFAREHLIRQNRRFCHLPLKGKAEWLNLTGWDYNPSVAVGDTSLCTREAALRVPGNPSSVTFGDTFPSGKADFLGGRRWNTSSVKTFGFATFPSRGRLCRPAFSAFHFPLSAFETLPVRFFATHLGLNMLL
ncbi:MAG: hypothetical protein IJA17_01705, partial [Oscillospiraceae bacterium]|nr:hypothetical protein [Oscillospiraceae bacterium]